MKHTGREMEIFTSYTQQVNCKIMEKHRIKAKHYGLSQRGRQNYPINYYNFFPSLF